MELMRPISLLLQSNWNDFVVRYNALRLNNSRYVFSITLGSFFFPSLQILTSEMFFFLVKNLLVKILLVKICRLEKENRAKCYAENATRII